MKNQYILLTGSKNNAGDFLIKSRAKELLKTLKPDTKLIDYNAWEELSAEKLSHVNESKALILLGGPALQNKMYPNIYKLTKNLHKIKVPIITMGIGWYSKQGLWKNTHDYPLSHSSIELLKKINNSGYQSSVRDYHTLNVLNNLGFSNFKMTGCPALYSDKHIGKEVTVPKKIKRIGYSLGASIKTSTRMFKQMQEVLLITRKIFNDAKIQTVFHHAPSEKYLNSEGSNPYFHKRQIKFLNWLKNNNFDWVDISGNAENLKNYYQDIDLHIGYRVHAHIFMSSISKPSILLSEDGRGSALKNVIGGVNFIAIDKINNSIFVKLLHQLGLHYDDTLPMKYLCPDLKYSLEYELTNGVKFQQPRIEIDRHYNVMKEFIINLP